MCLHEPLACGRVVPEMDVVAVAAGVCGSDLGNRPVDIADGRTLYMTANHMLARVRTRTLGLGY